jgi:hypothetical protein
MPGAVYQSSSNELYTAGLNAPGSPVSINGLNALTAGWFMDGAYNMNVGNGAAVQHIPALDSIQEVQVQTANYSARYGTAGGAVVNAVTKNGTAQFHGNAYEYVRNNDFDARNFFNPVVSPLKQNNFGFSIGGPVILPHYNHERNKTFFFWNEDWRYRNNATTLLTATPTADMRAGNFQSEATRLGKPILDPTNNAPFPNNIIPTGSTPMRRFSCGIISRFRIIWAVASRTISTTESESSIRDPIRSESIITSPTSSGHSSLWRTTTFRSSILTCSF